jgi:alpha-beta hydrolase superfamily lysophospholipase
VGGTEIWWQAWLPDGAPRATLVIAHGAGEHSDRYAHVGTGLVDAGYAVFALDHRGHGKSNGRRADIESLDAVVADLGILIELAHERLPERKPFLLGHSMGGAIALAFACRHQEAIDALILSAPVAALEAAPAPMRMISKVLGRITPGLGVYSVDASAVSRDPEVVRDYETDSLVHHEKLPARTVAELTRAVESFPSEVGRLRLPLLVMHGTADRLAPVAGSKMIAERAGSEEIELRLYDGLYHEILNEPEQDQILAEIVAWLDERVDRVVAPTEP